MGTEEILDVGEAPDVRRVGERVRLRLDIAYDGSDFHGWAQQPGLRTVEGEITRALETLTRESIKLTVAGRTDAGVHASAQVAHVDVDAAWWVGGVQRPHSRAHRAARPASEILTSRLNGLLARLCSERARKVGRDIPRGSSDVVVKGVALVDDSFDARFCALARHYEYRLSDTVAARDPLRRGDVVWLGAGPLDVKAMNEGAATVLGEHDFLSFCRPREGATTIRDLREFRFERSGGHIIAYVSADAFCHSMVRSLVGASLEVGVGRRPPSWMGDLLAAASRTRAAPVAPAHGLTLVGVDYGPEETWARRAKESRQMRECC